jgi:hypothetical protein
MEIFSLETLIAISTILTTFCTIMVATMFSQIFLSIPYYKHFRDNDKVEQLLREAATFYAQELKLENSPTINLHLIFPKRYRLWYGLARFDPKKENTYEIYIMMNHNKYELLSTMAHEMVHIKQMNSGDFRLDVEKGRKYWKEVDHTHTKYGKQPWEKEAFDKERDLAVKFMKYRRMKFGPFLLDLSNAWLSI